MSPAFPCCSNKSKQGGNQHWKFFDSDVEGEQRIWDRSYPRQDLRAHWPTRSGIWSEACRFEDHTVGVEVQGRRQARHAALVAKENNVTEKVSRCKWKIKNMLDRD